MQCPTCDYVVVGRRSGYPWPTHCCQSCSWKPGTHGPRCAKIICPYVERPRVCPGCRRYAVTGISSTHCCGSCAKNPGTHGLKCQKRLPSWRFQEELGTPLYYLQLLGYGGGAHESEAKNNIQQSPPSSLDRCAYVTLLYGQDMEYALGALLVASSLRRFRQPAIDQPKLVLLHAADVPAVRLAMLRKFYDEVRLIENPIELPSDSPLVACSRDFGHPQFLKLHLLELDYEKVLYLDSDVLVRRNIDELFSLRAPAAMERIMDMPPHGTPLPNRVLYGNTRVRGIQGGVMLLQPDLALFQEMRLEVESAGELKKEGYMTSIGNEQDYLTWRYCHDKLEEQGHESVWTHLGCEYNCEVHAPSRYFGIGRERWLWMDWEREAAVLHFSAPFRKRGAQLLHEGGLNWDHIEDQHPRVRNAHQEWDAAVEKLRDEVAQLADGQSLAEWLGEGDPNHHIATFAILDSGREGGMIIRQVGEGELVPDACRFTFEAYTANCIGGLKCFPPNFSPGPPWGANFWAPLAAPLEERRLTDESEASEDASSNAGSGDGRAEERCDSTKRLSRDAKLEQEEVDSENGELEKCEKREHPSDPGQLYSFKEFVAFAQERGMSDGYGQRLWDQARRVGDDDEGSADDVAATTPRICRCEELRAMRCQVDAKCFGYDVDSQTESGLIVGAWLRHKGSTGDGSEQWAFGPLDDPPHFAECPAWQCFSAFVAQTPVHSCSSSSDMSSST